MVIGLRICPGCLGLTGLCGCIVLFIGACRPTIGRCGITGLCGCIGRCIGCAGLCIGCAGLCIGAEGLGICGLTCGGIVIVVGAGRPGGVGLVVLVGLILPLAIIFRPPLVRAFV